MPTNPFEPPKEGPEPPKREYAYPYRVYELVGLVVLLALAVFFILPLVGPCRT